jgi:bifunctional oligoribonuclease and PAP phosphatase NrnA
MPLDWSPLVDLIRRHQTFLLMTHVRPDADGMGSQLGLADALTRIGKKAHVVIASKLPPRYLFLDPDRTAIENFTPPGTKYRNVDAILVLDTGTWGQLGEFGDFMKSMTVPKAVIDHHRTQDDLGGLAFVDTTAEATGRLAYEIIRALGAPLSAQAANNLFMALALDTGWFRHSNTTDATFDLAAELVKAGANPTPLYEKLFETAPMQRLKLLGAALERIQTRANGKIAFTEVMLKDYAATGAVPGDTEDLINYPRSIDGVDLAMIFIEQHDGGTKVSFRSRTADVSKLAEQFNGGGHKLASGARLMEPLTTAREKVIAAAEKLLQDEAAPG